MNNQDYASIIQNAPFAFRLKWTYAIACENEFGWVDPFSRVTDSPLTETQYLFALGYLSKTCSKSHTRKGNFTTANLIHGSGIAVLLQIGHEENEEPWANSIIFSSTTNNKNIYLAQKAGLPQKTFREMPEFLEWYNSQRIRD